jgi:WD40 repeat protein
MRFGDDERHLLVSTVDGPLRIWDVERGTFDDLPGDPGGDLLRPLGRDRVVAAGLKRSEVTLWDLGTRQPIRFPALGSPLGDVLAVDAFRQIVVGTDDGRLLLDDPETGTTTELRRYPDPVMVVMTGRDRRSVAVGTWGGQLDVLDPATWKFVRSETLAPIHSLNILGDGTIATVDSGHALRFWPPTADDKRVRQIEAPYARRIHTDHAGSRFATMSRTGIVKIFDAARTPILEIHHGNGPADLIWSRHADRIATGGGDGRIMIVDLATGAQRALAAGWRVWAVDLGLADRVLTAASPGNYIMVWRLDELEVAPTEKGALIRWLRARAPHLPPAPPRPPGEASGGGAPEEPE